MADCRCGHPFGSRECLAVHKRFKDEMEAVAEDRPHEHRWLKPHRGVSWCAYPTCDEFRRVDP